MRLSEFWRLMDDEFGAGYSRVLADELVLGDLDGRTAAAALRDGESPKRVWSAVCDVQDIPPERRWGRDIKPRSA
ncbi:DUF3046 domain-containing protein [Arthrobacter castelli]|uniref:DUF3046 domain-containing protein n=1 Tax=Arthrobacter castelli TaxID=271431 RepID=UPI0004223B1D|nr:DUF3046 domain-containing protein [Arthrobacter castelli]